MAITISNYSALEENATSGFPGAPYNYTPTSGVQAVLVIVAGKNPGRLPAPSYAGNAMTLLHRCSWHANNTGEICGLALYYYATTSTSLASISLTFPTGTNPTGSVLLAMQVNEAILGVEEYYSPRIWYAAGLPDPAPGSDTVNVTHAADDCILSFGHGLGASALTGTALDTINLLTSSLAFQLDHLTPGTATTTAITATYQGFQRTRGFSALRLIGGTVDSVTITPHKFFCHKYMLDQDMVNATVPVSGLYSGSPTAIEVRVLDQTDDTEVVTWTTVDASPTGGTWSGSIAVPRGGPYYLQARHSNATSVTGECPQPFYAAIGAVASGQSNASTLTSPSSNYRLFHAGSYMESDGEQAIQKIISRGLELWLYDDFGVPSLSCVNAVGGSKLDGLDNPSDNYTALLSLLDTIGTAHFFVWQQGQGDCAVGTAEATYEALISALHNDLAVYQGLTKSEFQMVIGSVNRSLNGYSAAGVHNVRKAQVDAGSVTGAHYSHMSLDCQNVDNLHMYQNAGGSGGGIGQADITRRFGLTIANAMGLAANNASLFATSAIKRSNTEVDVKVTHKWGTDLTPTSGIPGFEVSGDGSSWITATGARYDRDTIRLTHASNASDPMYVRYLYGEDPRGDTTTTSTNTMLRDNSSYAIPVNYTTDNLTGNGSSAPTVVSATIDSTGKTLTVVHTEAVTSDYAGYSVDGHTLIGNTGSTTDTLVFYIDQVYDDESSFLSYSQATGNSTGSGGELIEINGFAVTNNSSVSRPTTAGYNSLTGVGNEGSRDASLEAHYTFTDTAASTTVAEYDGSPNATASTNASTLTAAQSDWPSPGFDLAGLYDVTIPASVLTASETSEELTICMRARLHADASIVTDHRIINGWGTGSAAENGFLLWADTNAGDLRWGAGISGDVGYAADGSFDIDSEYNIIFELAWSGTQSTVTVWANGTQVLTVSTTNGDNVFSVNFPSIPSLIIGSFSSGGYFDGVIRDVQVYSRTLTSDERAQYAAGTEPVHASGTTTISGTETQGQTLTATPATYATAFGGANGSVTLSYQWYRSDNVVGTNEAEIAGATSNTYTLQAADVGKNIRVRVRATNSGGFTAAEDTWSAFTGPIASGSSAPTLSSATINAAGNELELVFSENMTGTVASLDVDGYTLSSGVLSGDTITFDISQVYSDEFPALDYVASLGDLTGAVSGEPLGDLTDAAITNNSTVSPNPTVTTGAASSIGTATASVAGTVTSEGRESVTERGVVWATTTAPETSDNKVTAGTGLGAFSASLTGLPDNTLIYFRAFATNASGTSYGSEDTFTTLDDPAPTITSVRFAEGGTRIRVAFSEAVTGTTVFSTDDGTITYVSGEGTGVYLFSFTGTPTTLSYTPGNVVDSISQALGASGPTAIGEELESSGSFFIEALGATISWSIGDSLSG